jgi:hypothetical protein
MNSLQKLAAELHPLGVHSFFQKPDQLVVTQSEPNYPTVNSFWIQEKNGRCYLVTWAPNAYEVPAGGIAETCHAILNSSETALIEVPEMEVSKYGLRKLNTKELIELLEE